MDHILSDKREELISFLSFFFYLHLVVHGRLPTTALVVQFSELPGMAFSVKLSLLLEATLTNTA
jgi:hypothetical protein